MAHEGLTGNAGSTPLALPREILEMLCVDAKGEVDISVIHRTLTARPVTDSQPSEAASRQNRKKRIAGLNRGMISMSEDFDAPVPDEFWLGHE